MAVQPMHKADEARNPRSLEEARALVKRVESLFMPWNVDALVDGFTEDCVVRFGTLPEIRGRDAIRTFFNTRSARQRNYRLTKELRSLQGNVITNIWNGAWEDAETGAAMKGFGVEIWVMRDGRIAQWEAAFNVGRADQTASLADILR
ncbi:MAG TPA: nuclear transport factor 2 family protein [Reyranella sp.]|jgi:nuclear transport factor 2 (NTF2) superfamily protein|nr:nuclear transport factor 2 family protein [Reyranella sp.]